MKAVLLSFLVIVAFSSNSQNLDINLLEEFNSDRNTHLDPAFRFITNSVAPLTFAVPAGFITYALIKKDSTSKHNAVNLCTSLIMSGIITTGLKAVIHRARPFQTYSFIHKETLGGGYSFPSGHTSSAFALATSVSIAYPKWYVIAPSFLYASAVGYSRMDLGVHYPSDVLIGAIIGSGSAFLSYKLNKWIRHKHSRRS
jgi:membrane-associated phospholipid phosphatase